MPEAVMEIKWRLSDPNYVESCLKELVEAGLLAKHDTSTAHYITEKGKKWLDEVERRLASATPKVPAKAPASVCNNAESLRRAFKVPSTEQVKKTFKRLIKVNQYGKKVVDKNVLALLRTYAFKTKLARKLEQDIKKPSPD